MHNTDKVIDYIIGNASKLTPEKIKALSEVVAALGEKNEASHEPNTLPKSENQEELMTPGPIDFGEVTGVQIDKEERKKVEIVKADYAGS